MKPKIRGSKLFRKYFSAFMVILLSCFTFLGSALLVFSSNYWMQDRHNLLSLNTQLAARDISDIYAHSYSELPSDARREALLQALRSNSDSIGAEFFIFDTDGRVVELSDVTLPGDRTELVFTTPLSRW